ncbi:MAG: SUMF1/EgtB/PvdO family nonheme iron enzyme [Armatimonadetes bacterium]|nr:SUMF1/EgtB/PvdO family nonheme iron enzyme [Armatimonadota bacterium]
MTAIATIAALSIVSYYPATDNFEEKISGTVVKLKMIGVPASGDTKSFFIGETEVTWDLFDIWAFRLDQIQEQIDSGVDAESRPSRPYGAPDWGFGHAGYPAIGMTSHAAETFCKWISTKTGRKYRLPTEAEWEVAARAGATALPGPLDKYAWFWDNAMDKTHSVAKKAANAFGLFDTLGNVAEWCIRKNGTAVVAGGSYNDKKSGIDFGVREKQLPKWNQRDPQIPKSRWWLCDAPFVGFRLVCER